MARVAQRAVAVTAEAKAVSTEVVRVVAWMAMVVVATAGGATDTERRVEGVVPAAGLMVVL